MKKIIWILFSLAVLLALTASSKGNLCLNSKYWVDNMGSKVKVTATYACIAERGLSHFEKNYTIPMSLPRKFSECKNLSWWVIVSKQTIQINSVYLCTDYRTKAVERLVKYAEWPLVLYR
jgi:hypothetical protein